MESIFFSSNYITKAPRFMHLWLCKYLQLVKPAFVASTFMDRGTLQSFTVERLLSAALSWIILLYSTLMNSELLLE